ncbi:uncharacterized protein LOC105158850 [Sesamum indicum]|uniref:Uncharacterized protein LOC105158850 n=1 Tax=Sesamum indicum TaxID=4182 RepID=A0A6I9SV01_SESIN|nr:uncharacterized protein LOC105158850 [Sesamum indicum]
MGGCFSSESDYSHRQRLTANVVSVNGELRQYPLPITVSQVLHFEAGSPGSFFVCSSDGLYFDDYIPSLDAEDELESAQIYFVLPVAKLQHRLAAADMAALAVKASAALTASDRRRSRKARISPVLAAEEDPQSNHQILNKISPLSGKSGSKGSSSSSGLGISRSGSMRKLQRNSSRRAKLAVRSFKLRLTTINEGSVLYN